MKLFTRGLLLIAVPSVFELVFLGLLFQGQQATNVATEWELHSKDILVQTNRIDRAVLSEAVRFRGAVIAHQPSEAAPAFWDDLDQRIALLERSISDNPSQMVRVERIRELATGYRASLQETLRITSNLSEADVTQRYQSLSTKGVLVQLEGAIQTFLDEERRLDDLRAGDAARARSRQNIVLLLITIGSVIVAVLVARVFARSVGERLKALQINAQQLAVSGELLPPISGNDEIADVDHALHQSSDDLRKARIAATLATEEARARALELAGLNRALRQQTEDNEMFVYSVSHDLRSPLVNMQGFSKEVRLSCEDLRGLAHPEAGGAPEPERIVRLIDDDIFSSLKYLDSAVLRAAGIIDALLRLSRAGRVVYEPRMVDVGPIVARVVDAAHSMLAARGATIVVGELPPSYVDASAVEQVFGNFINNAIAYLDPSRPGHIEVGSVAAKPGEVGVTYFVRDNGLGIAAHLLPKIFVAFQRLHGSVAVGEGIGLALVWRAVGRNGGRVWVESVSGEGSTFFVSFPSDADQTAIESTARTEPRDTQPTMDAA